MRRPVTGLSRSRERGAIAVVVAFAISALLTLLVLVMNVGHGYSVRAELQNAGDSAALAGVADIGGVNLAALSASLGTARATALNYAAAHRTDATNVSLLGGDVCFGTVLPGAPFQQLSCGGPPANHIRGTVGLRRVAITP